MLAAGTAARRAVGRATGDIPLGDRPYPMLRIEADPRSTGFSAAPAIIFGLARREIVFLAVGTPPYVLAAGRAATSPAYLPLASLMTQAEDGTLAVATTGGAAQNAVVALHPMGDSGSGRHALL